MATIALGDKVLPKRNETGVVAAGIALDDKVTAVTDTIEIAKIPVGATLLRIRAKSSILLGATSLGIAPLDAATPAIDVDRYRAAAVNVVGTSFDGVLQLPDRLPDGGIVTMTCANAITAVSTGDVVCEYAMDPYVDNTDTGLQDS